MKKIIFAFSIIISITAGVQARNLNAFFSHCTFSQPGKEPYVETYLTIAGNSVVLAKNKENNLQGKIEIQWVYKQGDKIVHFDKYNLLSPVVTDTSKPIQDFVDQQRVPLPNGDYTLELKITDKNSSSQGFNLTQPVSINYPQNKINISDIELLESYTPAASLNSLSKSGYDLIPLADNFFPASTKNLKFYAEIYNANEALGNDDYLVCYSIVGNQNRKVVGDLVNCKKQKLSGVSVVLAELPLADVHSGNFDLAIEVKDKNNHVVASKQVLFQRSNPFERPVHTDDLSLIKIENTFVWYIKDKDTLSEYISSLYPVSSQPEVDVEENQLAYSNLESMQQFFYAFWAKRNAENPEQAWLDYNANVQIVDQLYHCMNKRGYETDRGRVYLQYGAPNNVDKNEYEQNEYPSEVWQYYKTDKQSNVKFVFMCADFTTNCFELIHSTAIGEFYDSNWENRLTRESKSAAKAGNVDYGDDYSHSDQNNSNTRAKEDFNHPK